MPMNTTLETRPGPPGTSSRASERAPATTCSTISAVDMLRCRPPWPVAQNGQAMPQPACEDTHRVTRLGVAHQHRLDERAVVQPPQGLPGGAAVGLEGAHRRHQRRQQGLDERVPLVGGQVGHLVRVVDQPGEVVRAELLGAEAREAPLHQQVHPLVGGQVREVLGRLAAAGRVEDQGKLGVHDDPILPHRPPRTYPVAPGQASRIIST